MVKTKKGTGPAGPATSTQTTTAGHHSNGFSDSSYGRCRKCRGLLSRPESLYLGACLACRVAEVVA